MYDRINKWWPLIMLGVLISCFGLGCGQSEAELDRPELVPVEGVVSINGKPEEGVAVTLMPMGSTSGQMSYGITDPAGKFTCEYARGGVGCPQGQYAILCSKMVTPEGLPIPEGKNAADVMAKDMIPPQFRSSTNPFQVIQVGPAGVSSLKIELNFKKK